MRCHEPNELHRPYEPDKTFKTQPFMLFMLFMVKAVRGSQSMVRRQLVACGVWGVARGMVIRPENGGRTRPILEAVRPARGL